MSENAKAGHAYYHAMAWSFEEWDELWAKSEDIVWGHTFGRMRGQYSVWRGSVLYYDLQVADSMIRRYKAGVYDDVAGMDYRALMENMMHTLATDIIEVADDGNTCRTFYMTPGVSLNCIDESGAGVKRGGHMWEYYGADFVWEDGQWLYLHEQVAATLGPGSFGDKNPGLQDYQRMINPPKDMVDIGPGHGYVPILQDPGPIAQRHTWLSVPDCIIPPVRPYATMDDKNSAVPLKPAEQ